LKTINNLIELAAHRVTNVFSRLPLYQQKRSRISSYLIVLLLMLLALLMRLGVAPVDAGLQYLTFFPAVTLSVIIGGFGPGIFAIFVGMGMATFIFVPPYYSPSLHSLQVAFWSNMVFLVDGIIVCTAVVAMHRYHDKMNTLITSLQRTRKIIETSSEGFWLCNAGGKVLDVNHSYCLMTGYTRDELLTMHISDLEANESPEEIAMHMRNLITQGYDIFETRHRCKNGGLINLEVSASYLPDQDGYFSVFVRDISERKLTQEYQRLNTQLLNSTSDSVFLVNLDGSFVYLNEAAWKSRGYTYDELIAMNLRDLNTKNNSELIASRQKELLQNGQAIFESEHFFKDGSIMQVEINARIIEWRGQKMMLSVTRDITERKHRDNVINKAKQELEELYNKAPCGYHSLDSEGRVIQINQTELDWLGYDRDELMGEKIRDYLTPLSVEAFSRNYPRFKQDGYIKDVEYEMVRKDGTIFPILLSANAVLDADENFIMSRSSMIDISDRKRRDEAITQTNAELGALYDNAPCGYHSLDAEGRIIRINQTEADWLGYKPEELIGRMVTDILSHDAAETFSNNYFRLKQEGSFRTIEADLMRRDGSTFTVLLSSKAVYDHAGNFTKNRTTVLDITERKKIAAALENSEARFRHLFEQAPIGIALAGQDQKIFAANAAYCEMFGYSLEELRLLTIGSLTHPDYADTTLKLAGNLFAGDIPAYSLEKKYLRKDGSSFWGRINATNIASENAQSHYILGMVENITERLERDEQRLSKVKEQRDVLVREVHHRIKNNLQGVVGLLRQHANDHPELAEVIENSIGRIYSIAIIHGLQAQALSEEVDLIELIKNIVSASGARVAYEGKLFHSVFLDREEAVPIALVLNELITNASKHCSKEGSITIGLETRRSDTIVTIANHFDTSRQRSTNGHGMDLVKSLLPRKSAKLLLVHTGNIFSVELTLSHPVIILEPKGVQ
jgi:PAS domain S-box-containing protein